MPNWLLMWMLGTPRQRVLIEAALRDVDAQGNRYVSLLWFDAPEYRNGS